MARYTARATITRDPLRAATTTTVGNHTGVWRRRSSINNVGILKKWTEKSNVGNERIRIWKRREIDFEIQNTVIPQIFAKVWENWKMIQNQRSSCYTDFVFKNETFWIFWVSFFHFDFLYIRPKIQNFELKNSNSSFLIFIASAGNVDHKYMKQG